MSFPHYTGRSVVADKSRSEAGCDWYSLSGYGPRSMWQTRCLLASVASVLLSAAISAQSPAATVAPTGTLRVVFLGGNPVQGRVDPKTGDVSGTVPDLSRE